MIDPKFCGEIKIFIVDANGNEHPINSVKSEDVQVKKEEPKTFPQSIADIVSEYEQMLIDWDMSRISDEEMEDRMAEFQLKSRPIILDMLDEIKTINHILGYIRTMLSSTRIAALYGDTNKTTEELSNIIKEIEYLRSKMEFTKVEPIIGKSAGPDEIEEFLNDEEEIEIIELDEDCNNNKECKKCSECKDCKCNNSENKKDEEDIDIISIDLDKLLRALFRGK